MWLLPVLGLLVNIVGRIKLEYHNSIHSCIAEIITKNVISGEGLPIAKSELYDLVNCDGFQPTVSHMTRHVTVATRTALLGASEVVGRTLQPTEVIGSREGSLIPERREVGNRSRPQHPGRYGRRSKTTVGTRSSVSVAPTRSC